MVPDEVDKDDDEGRYDSKVAWVGRFDGRIEDETLAYLAVLLLECRS
jgi:hypothetical protein